MLLLLEEVASSRLLDPEGSGLGRGARTPLVLSSSGPTHGRGNLVVNGLVCAYKIKDGADLPPGWFATL